LLGSDALADLEHIAGFLGERDATLDPTEDAILLIQLAANPGKVSFNGFCAFDDFLKTTRDHVELDLHLRLCGSRSEVPEKPGQPRKERLVE
jgi:hypothetical protein